MKKLLFLLFALTPSLIYAKSNYQVLRLQYKDVEFEIKVNDKIYMRNDTVNIMYAVNNKSKSSIWICDDKIKGDNTCGVYFNDKDLSIYLGLGGNKYVEFKSIPKYIKLKQGESYNSTLAITCNKIAEEYTNKRSIVNYSIFNFPIIAEIALFDVNVISKLGMDYITQFSNGSGFLKSDNEIVDYESNIKRINMSGLDVRIDVK